MIPLKDDRHARGRPYVTLGLIGLASAAFVWQRSLDEHAQQRLIAALGAIPAVLLTDARLPADLDWIPRQATLVSALFLHASWMHLLGNLLFLWIYGDSVEEALGHARFLLFYVACGVIALVAQALAEPTSAYPIIGASGAVAAVLGAYLLLFPRARVLTLVLLPFFATTLRVPAMLLLPLWFAVQLVSDLAARHGGAQVAFRAHIVGFIAGLALAPLLKRRGVRLFAA